MKIQICYGCDLNCIARGSCGIIERCLFDDDTISAWRFTEDYELKKKDNFTFQGVKPGKKIEDYEDLEKDLMKAKNALIWAKVKKTKAQTKKIKRLTNIPNCSLCKWIVMKLSTDDNSNIHSYDCMAMGGRDAHSCYGTDECKALYEGKE